MNKPWINKEDWDFHQKFKRTYGFRIEDMEEKKTLWKVSGETTTLEINIKDVDKLLRLIYEACIDNKIDATLTDKNG